METIIDFDTVSYTWPGGKGLHAVHFSLPRGGLALITGPSGAGKSTLLRLAARLEEPDVGAIRFAGRELTQYAPPDLRRRIGYVQQTPVVVEGSVRRNLLLPYGFAIHRDRPVPDDATLRGWLDRLALGGVMPDDAASTLSVGQKQRLCLIRSLLLQPELLLMDEPTSALDPESRAIVERMVDDLHADGVSILLVTHSGYSPDAAHQCLTVRDGRVEGSL